MTPRTWAYGDVEEGDEAVRDRPYESFGQQGFGLPTYANGPARGAERVDLGEPVAPSIDTNDATSNEWRRRDGRIHDDVCCHLRADGRIDERGIEVIVHHGEVILLGTVSDPGQRDRATQTANAAHGVVDVVNRLRVAPGGGEDGPSFP